MTSAESSRGNPARDILEVFGVIDHAVRTSRDNPELLAAADRLLPGSVANPGWYEEIERRFFPNDVREVPNLRDALARIADADGHDNRLNPAQKTRLLYGISASAQLNTVAPDAMPSFDQTDAAFNQALGESLGALAPANTALTDRRTSGAAAQADILQLACSDFKAPKDFDAMRDKAVADIRANKKMSAPLCKTSVVIVDGYESAVVDTEFDSPDVTLNQLKSIVNPFNWAQDYSELFVRMEGQEPDILPDKWRRVLETVRLLGSIELTTPLKFFPYHDPKNKLEARLDYDLDTPALNTGDGQVRVDRGFINMKSTSGDADQPGVHVATRKVVHIERISAFAQAKLVCIGGYGTASATFLLGAAAKPPQNPEPFEFPTNEDEADKPKDATTIAPPATAITHFVPAAVGAWTECAQNLTNSYFDVAQKWLSGSLTMTDLADYSTSVTSELASSPWKYLQAMTTPRSPGKPGGSK